MDKLNFIQLIDAYLDGSASDADKALLEAYYEKLQASDFQNLSTRQEDALEEIMYSNIVSGIHTLPPKKSSIKLWPRIAVAAAAVAAIVFGVWFYTIRLDSTTQPADQANAANDIAPGKQGATLTLASGKKIRLKDAVNGEIAKEAGIIVTKTADGQLAYEIKEASNAANRINTLSTAKGETYIVTLPDKSKVWLNAASSLTYAANLNERGARRVKLKGEAYFEVAKDKAHPFIVETAKQEVEVLGTHFNINSYANEEAIVTTLIEGSVKLSSEQNKQLLKPGYQAINTDNIIKITAANIDNAMDWKNGGFYLDGIDFKVAMRKIARWYNVDVVYDASVPDDIETGGWISRDKSLLQVLKFMETSGLIHFKIEGRKVYVSK